MVAVRSWPRDRNKPRSLSGTPRSSQIPLPVSVICELLGVPESDRGLFRSLGHDLTATIEPNAPDADAADAASDELIDYFTHFVADKRREPGDDLTSALLATHDADPTALSA